MSQPTTIMVGTRSYAHLETVGNRSTYYEEGVHTDTLRSLLQLYRTAPKRSGNFLGVRKLAIKLTQDIEVATADGGTTIVPDVREYSEALPVGITNAQAAKAIASMTLITGDDTDLEIPTLQQYGDI
jgi:hypothetical protein